MIRIGKNLGVATSCVRRAGPETFKFTAGATRRRLHAVGRSHSHYHTRANTMTTAMQWAAKIAKLALPSNPHFEAKKRQSV